MTINNSMKINKIPEYAELPRLADLVSITDDANGLTLRFSEDGKEAVLVEFTFERAALIGYRMFNETYRTKVYPSLPDYELIRKEKTGGFVYKIENSELVEWLNDQSTGITTDMELLHYFFSTEDAIDVVSRKPPVMKMS